MPVPGPGDRATQVRHLSHGGYRGPGCALARSEKNIYETVPNDESREMYRVPALVEEMARRGWLGEKTGQGFYKRVKGDGEREILTLDVNTMEYRPAAKGALCFVRKREDHRGRHRAFARVDRSSSGRPEDRQSPAIPLGSAVGDLPLRSAACAGNLRSRCRRRSRHALGALHWELGPFQLMDAIKA